MTRCTKQFLFFGVSLIILSSLLGTAEALSCPCWDDPDPECPEFDPAKCTGGVTTDACGCCDTCKKVEGEECNGPWGVDGICADGLVCQFSSEVPESEHFQETGICAKEEK